MLKVDTSCLENQAVSMQTIANKLNTISDNIDSVNRALRWNTSINFLVRTSLKASGTAVSALDGKASALSRVLREAANEYKNAEKKAEKTSEQTDGSDDWSDTIRFVYELVYAILTKPIPVISLLSLIKASDYVSDWLEREGTWGNDRTWFGYESNGSSGVTAWIGKVGDREEYENGYAEVNAYLGKVEGQVKADGGFMKVRSEDGSDSYEFLYGELGAGGSVNVVSVDTEMGVGDDMLGLESSAKLDIGNASAKGQGEFSIGEEGVDANLGGELMVSALEAEAKGTINILGFEITLKAGGYAGAAGVEGKVGIDDNKFVCEGGIAAGLGISGGIEIGLNEEGWDNFVDIVIFWD